MKSATESDTSTPPCVFFQLCLFQPVFQFVVNAFFLLTPFGMVYRFPSLNTAVRNQQNNNKGCVTFGCKTKRLHLLRYTYVGFSKKLRPPRR